MNIFSSLFRSPKSSLPPPSLDLDTFSCGHSRLGHRPDPRDSFTTPLARSSPHSAAAGLELGSKDGVLDYVHVTLPAFKGAIAGKKPGSFIDSLSSLENIITIFGPPYWQDSSDGETVLFYEYDGGHIELQFEFSAQKKLAALTFMKDGILSDPEQRQSYAVSKPWPPQD